MLSLFSRVCIFLSTVCYGRKIMLLFFPYLLIMASFKLFCYCCNKKFTRKETNLMFLMNNLRMLLKTLDISSFMKKFNKIIVY